MKFNSQLIACALLVCGVSAAQTGVRTDSLPKPIQPKPAAQHMLVTQPSLTVNGDTIKKATVAVTTQTKNFSDDLATGKAKRDVPGTVSLMPAVLTTGAEIKFIAVPQKNAKRDTIAKKNTTSYTHVKTVYLTFRTCRLQTMKVEVENDPFGAIYYYLEDPANILNAKDLFSVQESKLIASNDQTHYILLKDIIVFNPKNPQHFVIEDQDGVVLNATQKQVNLKGANELPINGVAFTDLEGFSEDKPNGILQSEISIPMHLIRRSIWNTKRSSSYFLYNIMPEFVWSKPDKKLRYLPVGRTTLANGGTVDYVHTFGLWQYSNFRLGGKINLFMLDMPNLDARFYVDYQFFLLHTGVSKEHLYPNAKLDSVRDYVYSYTHGISTAFIFNQSGPFRGEFRFKMLWVDLSSIDLVQSEGAYFNQFDRLKAGQTYAVPSSKFLQTAIYIPELTLTYKPDKEKDRKLYFRVAIYNNLARHYSFLQVQTGVTANLRDMFTKVSAKADTSTKQ